MAAVQDRKPLLTAAGPSRTRTVGLEQVPTSVTLRLWLADHFFKYHALRQLLSRKAIQFLSPLPLADDAPEFLPWNTVQPPTLDTPAVEMAVPDSDHLLVQTGEDEHFVYSTDLKVGAYTLYRVGAHWKVNDPTSRKDFFTRFAHTKLPTHVYGEDLVVMYLTGLRPSDVHASWFPALAGSLKDTQVQLTVSCQHGQHPAPSGSRASIERRKSLQETSSFGLFIGASTFEVKATVNGLTTALLVMKSRGDFLAMARVFSYAPSQIAQEIRHYDLAAALGVQATSFLLDCIFAAMKINQYVTNQPELIQAATHLLVSHLGRKDFKEFLRLEIPGTQGLVAGRLVELLRTDYGADPLADFTMYAKMATLRDGVIWGSMRAFAKDVDAHNQASVALLSTFASTATSLFSAAATNIPEAGSNVGTIIGDLGTVATWAVAKWASGQWQAGELDAALAARFDIQITGPAKAGNLPGLKQDQWRWKNKQTEQNGSKMKENDQAQKDLTALPRLTPLAKQQVTALGTRSRAAELLAENLKAGEAKPNSDTLSKENVQIIQDVYLGNIGYIVTFAMSGSVTPRLSTLRRVYTSRR